MSTLLADPVSSAAIWIVIKSSVILAVAAIAQLLLRRRRASAAARHLVWTFAIAGLLLLPILSVALPDWPVVFQTAEDPTPAAPTISVAMLGARAPEASSPGFGDSSPSHAAIAESASLPAAAVRMSWPDAIGSVYAAGLIAMSLLFAMQWRTARRLTRAASAVQDPAWTTLVADCARTIAVDRDVRVLRSRERSMPMVLGIHRPTILIPAIADTWCGDRRRAVILHELAHVARHDCLTQTMASAACAIYWFHPAAWWVAHRLRVERELACDDRVIAAGTQAREYAGHLLEIAYAFGSHRAPALAVNMARPRQLEGRLLAALDAARNRSVPAMGLRVAGALIVAALLVPLASATTTVVVPHREADRVVTATAPDFQLVVTPFASSIEARLVESAWMIVRAAAAAVGVMQEQRPGTWEIRPTKSEGVVHLRMVELNSSFGSNIRIEQLEGLTAAQLAGAGGPVKFRLNRDAGSFVFEGVLRNGVAAGTFSFTASPTFAAGLAKRGFGSPTWLEQYQLARHDIGYGFVDELEKQSYTKPPISELVRAGQHGVDTTYLREMGALGYRLGTLEPLITLRDHGVTPGHVRGLADLGYKGIAADDLRKARDHGVDPEFARAWREAGYGSLTLDDLITARDHGVSAEFVRALGDAGHPRLPLDQLTRVRDHGVSAEYARGLRQLGYGLSIDELVRARDHGVSLEYVRAMRERGYGSLTMDALINARDHGVDVDFVSGLAALGYTSVPLDDVIRLRDHGVTAKYAQDLKALGYDRLAIDDLVLLRDHGLTPERIRDANARAKTRLPIDLLLGIRD